MTTSPLSSIAMSGTVAIKTAARDQNTGSTFDSQLSQALSESLAKLGVAASEINISVRNGSTAGSRQITITYGDAIPAPAATTPATTPVTAPAETAPRLNPFTMGPGAMPLPTNGAQAEVTQTSWAPYDGPRDHRDSIPAGGGQVTTSGAPLIKMNDTPARNQYNYTGPGASNPYFTNPGNPLRDGYVLGFRNWFKDAMVMGTKNGPTPANRNYFATEEGAQEALRLVRQYAPDAQLTQRTWGGGPYVSNTPMYVITLPNGGELNAGGVVADYYTGGSGVTTWSDYELERAVRTA